MKPTPKVVEKRTRLDKENLEKMWAKTAAAISKLQQTPDSVESFAHQ